MIEKVVSLFGRGKAALLALFAMAMVGMASAQTGDWDISGATTTVNTLLAAGAVITIALVVFKLAKRGANKV